MDSADINDRVRLLEPRDGEAAVPELQVDGVPVRYGQFPDGIYFVYDNAYVWSDDLRALGRQLVIDRDNGRVPVADNDGDEK